MSVNGAQKLYTGAIVELDNGTHKEFRTVTSVSGTVVTFDAALVNSYVETDWLRVFEAEVLVSYQSADGQLIQEDFTNLRIADAGTPLGNDPNSLWVAVNNQSQLVTLTPGAAFSTVPAEFPTVLTPPRPAGRRLADAVRRRRQAWLPERGGLRRDRRGQRASDRHPGDGRHRRDRDLRRTWHVVPDRAGAP